jgi:hypothetical protein
MKIQYVAYDGKVFNNENECRTYEGQNFLMASFSGTRTFDFEDDASFIYIPDKKTLKFFQEIYSESRDVKNITDIGFYIWDIDEFKYIRLNLDTFDGLRNFLQEYFN